MTDMESVPKIDAGPPADKWDIAAVAFIKPLPLGTDEVRGRPQFVGILDDYSYFGPKTFRIQCRYPNFSDGTPTIIHVPLAKYGRNWRMAAGTGGMPRIIASSWVHKPGFDRRPFRTRQSALKYCRKLWPSAHVELGSGGLLVRPTGHHRWNPCVYYAILNRDRQYSVERTAQEINTMFP